MPLLYSLLDEDPDRQQDSPPSPRTQARRLRDSIREDLQDLLNTRRRCLSWPGELSELQKSVLDYGIDDLTGANLTSKAKRDAFLEELGRVIRRNDKRFLSVQVQSLENADPYDRTLRFRIEAKLKVETGSNHAIFDFQLEPVTRHIE